MSYKSWLRFSVMLVASYWLSSCLLTAHPTGQNDLLITGSSTIEPLINRIANRYENEHPGVQINIEAGGSGRGLTDTRQGNADIGMISRALAKDETDLSERVTRRL